MQLDPEEILRRHHDQMAQAIERALGQVAGVTEERKAIWRDAVDLIPTSLDGEILWITDRTDYVRERAAMHTPHVPEALRMYDHLPPIEAILRAWTQGGPYPEWHAKMRAQVHALMPVLAHNLERLEATSHA